MSLQIVNRPGIVAHADWSSNPKKRWLALARLEKDGSYTIQAPQPAGEIPGLLRRLRESAGTSGPVLVGFDFPIGLPAQYAARAGIHDFLALLPLLGQEEWNDFYRVAAEPDEINLRRPFYPLRPGKARQTHLLHGLQMSKMSDLWRACDRPYAGRRAACPLFWTMGGQQVGKAAIHGWKEVLGPGLRESSLNLAIWPFSGPLNALLNQANCVAAETYPAEYYTHLGITFSPHRPGGKSGKRVQRERAANSNRLLEWAASAQVYLEPSLTTLILDGFGPSPEGEDLFDTIVGLFGMLNNLMGLHPFFEPENEMIRK